MGRLGIIIHGKLYYITYLRGDFLLNCLHVKRTMVNASTMIYEMTSSVK